MIAHWHPTPDSSNVSAIGFDEDTKEILVQFKGGGLYAYDVATTVFAQFVAASSKGQFVNQVFKGGDVNVRRIDHPIVPLIAQLEKDIQEAGGVG